MKVRLLLCFLSLFSVNFITQAITPPFSLARTVEMPNQVIAGTQGAVDYTFTNNQSSGTLHPVLFWSTGDNQFSPLPSYVVQNTDGTGLCNFTTGVTGGTSCTLEIDFNANLGESFNDGNIMVCSDALRAFCVGLKPSQRRSTTVIAQATSSMPTLTSKTSNLVLAPGKTSTLVVENPANSGVTVNNMRLTLPNALQPYLDTSKTSVLHCTEIAPGASCTFKIPMDATLPTSTTASIGVQASNSHAKSFSSSVDTRQATANNITFTAPGNQDLTITNENDANTITVTGITGLLSGVTAGSIPSSCQNLIDGASCSIPLTATANAVGSSTINIAYTDSDGSNTLNATVSVVNTTVTINDGADITGLLAGGNIAIKNTGAFNAQGLNFSRSASDTWLTLNTTGCSTTLVPQASCNISYTMTAAGDAASVISVSGTNITTSTQNFTPESSVSLGIDSDAASQHLAYRAIKVTNLTSSSQTLTNIKATIPAELTNKIVLCDSTGSNCDSSYASNCLTANKVLSPGGPGSICRLWFKADNSTTLGPASGSIQVSLDTNGNPELPRNFTFNYQNDLYVGGSFATAGGGTSANNIAKWNGTAWSALGAGANNTIRTMKMVDGDLYLGGSFTTIGETNANYIAKWNGTTWSTLGTGTDSVVRTLANIGNIIYAGGNFTTAGGVSANHIAQWNGFTWSALSTGTNNHMIDTLLVIGNELYAGGSFTTAGSFSANNIAKWNGVAWSALAGGVDSRVQALVNINNDIYAGGWFATADDTNARRIGKWSGTNWSTLGTGIDNGNAVYALLNINNDIYAGGTFTSAGGITANNIAKWNGTTWSTLGSGMDSDINVLVNIGNDIYAGGIFTSAGGVSANRIAKWNGTTWSALGSGISGGVYSLLLAPSLTITTNN